jgi:hypothetical protein
MIPAELSRAAIPAKIEVAAKLRAPQNRFAPKLICPFLCKCVIVKRFISASCEHAVMMRMLTMLSNQGQALLSSSSGADNPLSSTMMPSSSRWRWVWSEKIPIRGVTNTESSAVQPCRVPICIPLKPTSTRYRFRKGWITPPAAKAKIKKPMICNSELARLVG